MKLNIGCGRYPKEGFTNLDWKAGPGVDVVHDLSVFPYPLDDNSVELITADHVIEHLPEVFKVMEELHRILAPGGKLVVRTPHFSRGFSHPEHRRGFGATFPNYFRPSFPGGYTGIHFECERIHMRWFAQPYLKRSVLPKPLYWIARVTGIVIDFFANLSPLFSSRIWCYYVGGFEEISFVMRKSE